MTLLIAYFALVLYPLVVYLIPNPVGFYWGFTRGRAPMPPEVLKKAERAGRYTLFVMHGFLLTGIFYFVRQHSIPAAHLGLHSERWGICLAIGCLAGLAWVGLQIGLIAIFRIPVSRHQKTSYLLRGSFLLWTLISFSSAFAEELWRAFCLVALINTGHSVPFAVAVSATVFGAGHLRLRLGGACAVAVAGAGCAVLFLWLGTLVTPFAAHFTANAVHMCWVRRASPAT